MKINFEIWGIPKGQGRPRSFRFRKGGSGEVAVGVHDPVVSARWKDLVFMQVSQHRPAAFLEGPLRCRMIFRMPLPESKPAVLPRGMTWKRAKEVVHSQDPMYELPHGVRPDLDQLVKPILDMLKEAGYFKDDALVADWDGTRKIYGLRPGVEVLIEEVE